jgi:hypothetical protein
MRSEQRFEDRAKDPVSRLFVRRLMVPKIYFDARWPESRSAVDLLAIDRAGTSDVHVVVIKSTTDEALASIARLHEIPAQYRWLAFTGPKKDKARLAHAPLFSSSGPGRIGVIRVLRKTGDVLEAEVLITAERFAGSLVEQVDRFVARHPADIEFRP